MERFITVGIAGHIDHGKTALVRCLTGIDTDRLQEEKRRGLSIMSSIAPLDLFTGRRIALVDVPGHTDFLKNTIRGLSCVDMAVLVVAADDGVMPQTLEHIRILDFFGAKNGFTVLSKTDMVDEEILELAELEIREALEGTFLDGKPVIHFSTVNQRGLDEIRIQLEKLTEEITCKDINSPFRLWIDHVKGFPGFGTVVSGTILSGVLEKDDHLYLLPSCIKTRARSLEIYHEKSLKAFAGQRVGINLHKIPIKKVTSGMALSKPETVNPGSLLNVDIQVLESAKIPVKNRQRVKLYLGTSVTNTLVVLMENNQLKPGERGLAQFRLMKPVAAFPKDPFVICPLNIRTVIGGGRVLEIPGEKYRRARESKTVLLLKALRKGDLKIFIKRLFEMDHKYLVKIGDLARNTGFPINKIEEEIRAGVKSGELLIFKDGGVFSTDQYQRLKGNLPKIIEKILQQNPLKMTATARETKNQLAASLDETVFQTMLAEICNEGKLIKSGGGFNIPGFSVKLSDEREGLINLSLDYARESGFVPFSADTFWRGHGRKVKKNEIQRLLDYLYSQKKIIRLNNRRNLGPQAMEQIKKRVKQLIKKNGRLTIGDCKEVLGYGRTVGVPVFEYLDSIGFTLRQGDERVLAE